MVSRQVILPVPVNVEHLYRQIPGLTTNCPMRSPHVRRRCRLRDIPDGPPQLRIPGVCFQALPRCVHSISLQLSFRSGVSTPTSSWPPSLLGRDFQFSGPHDGCDESGFYVVHIAVSRRVCPEVPSNRCGHLLSKLGIIHQVPTVHWQLRPLIGGFEQNGRRA